MMKHLSQIVLSRTLFGLVLIAPAAALAQTPAPAITGSHIVVYNVKQKKASVIYTTDKLIEAPAWSPDGRYLLVNTGGGLYRIRAVAGAKVLEPIDLKGNNLCNNDKGFSPDGKLIAFSSGPRPTGSQVFTVGAQGGEPKLIISHAPSYFHGFSPDGKWMAIVAGMSSNNYNLFRVPIGGGEWQQLTTSTKYDDGPDYSRDGKWIYFNSNRSGSWQVWRMPAEGAGPKDVNAQQITNDEQENWFPHPSPDGKWLVFLTFPKGTAGHNQHLDVMVRMIPQMAGAGGGPTAIQTLATFFGGQGTMNVNSWSPDSTRFAYVEYEH